MVADGCVYVEALRYYEAAEPFFAAALPPLHPVGGIRALELSKLAAGLGQFDRGLRYGAKAKVVLSITHGADAPVLRTVNGARLSPPVSSAIGSHGCDGTRFRRHAQDDGGTDGEGAAAAGGG